MNNKRVEKRVIKKRVFDPSVQTNHVVNNVTETEGVAKMENKIITTDDLSIPISKEDTPILLGEESTLEENSETEVSKNDANLASSEEPTTLTAVEVTVEELQTKVEQEELEKVESAPETAAVKTANLEATSSELPPNAEPETPKEGGNPAANQPELTPNVPNVEVKEDELQTKVEQKELEKVESALEPAAAEPANLEAASFELPSNAEPETPKEGGNPLAGLPEQEKNVPNEEQQQEAPSLYDVTESNESTVPVEDKSVTSEQVKVEEFEEDDTLLDGAIATTPNSITHRQMNAPLTVVNHKNGKRVKIGKEVCEKLQLADGDLVDVLAKDDTVLVCKSLITGGHCLSKGCLIYNKELVELITDVCVLNFEGKSSNSLTQVKYVQSQGRLVAVITK